MLRLCARDVAALALTCRASRRCVETAAHPLGLWTLPCLQRALYASTAEARDFRVRLS